jgi:CBS domain-containing protein
MQVQELMTKNVASCSVADPCSVAVRLMWDCDCGAVPVLGHDGGLVGVVTDRDICMATWMQDCSPRAIPVSAVMSRDLCVCAPTDDVAAAEQRMRDRQLRRLPVVGADRRLIGILSLADIVREANGRGRKRIVPDEVAATLADICQPRPGVGISSRPRAQ